MHSHYTALGAVPALAQRASERRDAMLAHTGPGAREVLRQINKFPRGRRVAELNRVLVEFDVDLPARVQRAAAYLQRGGMNADLAVERALALGLADASIARVQKIGRLAQSGMMFPMGALGSTGLGDEAADAVARTFQGIVCSPALAASTSSLVGRNEGADAAGATQVGFALAAGMAQCPAAPVVPVTPVTPPASTAESSMMVPILIGVGALALVGGGIWFATRK